MLQNELEVVDDPTMTASNTEPGGPGSKPQPIFTPNWLRDCAEPVGPGSKPQPIFTPAGYTPLHEFSDEDEVLASMTEAVVVVAAVFNSGVTNVVHYRLAATAATLVTIRLVQTPAPLPLNGRALSSSWTSMCCSRPRPLTGRYWTDPCPLALHAGSHVLELVNNAIVHLLFPFPSPVFGFPQYGGHLNFPLF